MGKGVFLELLLIFNNLFGGSLSQVKNSYLKYAALFLNSEYDLERKIRKG